MSIFREFNINMIPGKPPLIIHVSQYESDFVYTFNLISGKSVLAIPDTAIAVIRGTKRDGNGFSKEASLDTENNKVVVIGEVQMTACAGRNVFELAIINDEKVICTANFFLDVERAPLDSDTIRSETVLHDLQAIINSAATATQAAEEASASAAEAAESARTLTIDPTLTQSGQAADAKVVGDEIDGKVSKPTSSPNGTTGQLLRTNGDGTTQWVDQGLPTDEQTAEAISEWLTNHPEATTTVQDGAVTSAKLANNAVTELKLAPNSVSTAKLQDGAISLSKLNDSVKASIIPEVTDFGGLSIDTINSIFAQDVLFLRLSGTLSTNEPIIINRPITLICDNFTVIQTVWGNPAIIVLSDNVRILGNITLICDVETRNPITNPYYPEDVDSKANSTGIMLGHGGTFSDFYAEHIEVKNFIAGICNSSVGFQNINIDYLYVENVDFGIFGAHYVSTSIKCVEFKDIASYEGSVDPSHAIYLTGGTSIGLSEEFVVGCIIGDGCRSKKSDTVISVKSTINFACKSGYVKNIAGLASVLISIGSIENVIVENATAGISTQLEWTDFTFKNIQFKQIEVSGEYINYFTSLSKAKVIDCEFNVISDDASYEYVYVSCKEYIEKRCKYVAPDTSTTKLYKRLGASNGFYVYEPTANIELFTGSIDSAISYMLIDPKKLNYPKTNCLVPNPHFVENGLVVDEQAATMNYPVGFRTNDKVRVTGATVNYFNTNNETNGVVYTLFNDGTSMIVNGNRLKTKTGANYSAADWSIFRFINIGNVAYEV